MTTYTTSTEIEAPASTVSGLLLDMPRWTSWTTTIQEATPLGAAVLSPGTRVRVRQPRLPVSVWTVDRADDDGLEWNNYRHGLRTVARHRIEASARGCRLTVHIEQAGFLEPPVRMLYGSLIRHHLDTMAAELKAAAQRQPIVSAPPELRHRGEHHPTADFPRGSAARG
jgi:hypothetical protein